MNKLKSLFTVHSRRKICILAILLERKKKIIVKFDYYGAFDYSVGDVLIP